MKKILAIYAALLFAGMAFQAAAQTGPVVVRQNTFALEGNSAVVGIDVTIGEAKLKPRNYVVFTPAIEAPGHSKALPSIMVNGRNRQKAYRRLVRLQKQDPSMGLVIDANDKNAPGSYQSYYYTVKVPFEEWMRASELRIYQEQCDCDGPAVPTSVEMLAKNPEDRNAPVVHEVVLPPLLASFITPEPETVKQRNERHTAYLRFPVDISVIKPEFGDNANELSRIRAIIEGVRGNSDYTFTGFEIDGYASPEGPLQRNITLSQNRAAALKEYIKGRYNYPESAFTVRGHGEDWAGTEAMLAESNIAQKQQIIDIIHSTTIEQGREKKIMDLAGGAPYREMLGTIFPRLRRLEFVMNYHVASYSVERGREVIKTTPASMSMNEMYMVAASYKTGSDEFNEAFETIARMYPSSDVANLNAAAAALARADVVSAQKYMEKVAGHDAAYLNNMGMLACLQGDRAKAVEYFTKAADAGNAEAKQNLGETSK